MSQMIGCVTFLVRDYETAIDYFVRCLGFVVQEDRAMGNGKRWVTVSPVGSSGTALLLAKASTPGQEAHIGQQTGGRVFLFLQTDDFQRDHARMVEQGVIFRESPREEAYGTVAVFSDLYGNLWDLIELKTPV